MKVKKHKVKIITLGCSKNLVDSEFISAQLKASDVEVVNDEEKANTVIINTCGFIEEAKQESINTILAAVEKKSTCKIKNVFVAGCLSDRYKSDLEKEIPDVDSYFGATDKPKTLIALLNALGADYKKELIGERDLTTPKHYAYLKISEGCDNPCSFCAIPIMRGGHKSKPLKNIMTEAQKLASKGVRELIVIGQDTTYWGFDLNRKREIAKVLDSLSEVNGIEWIRLMYAYPSRFPQDLINVFKQNDKLCKYLDIPVQHISDNVLKSMRRGITKKNQIDLLSKLKSEIPGLALRTTLIVGYPDETDKDFRELLDFVSDFEFDRLGVFTYSTEDDTFAAALPDRIPKKEKILRQKLILDKQREISLGKNRDSMKKVFKVLIDRKENDCYIGRTYKDAPEIDQEVYVDLNKKIKAGNFYDVKIYDYEDYDLFGELDV